MNLDHFQFDRVRTVVEYLEKPSATLHRELYSLKQESFPNDYRIIFSCFENLEIKQIEDFAYSLQKSLSFIDIPNFFVIFLSNNPTIKQILATATQLYSNEEDPIAFKLVDTPVINYDKTSNVILNPPESICTQPWISLDVTTNGEFRPCCFYNKVITKNNGTPFHAQVDTFDDVYNSDYMQKLREDFRHGSKPEPCARCWNEERDGTESKRQLLKHRIVPESYNSNWEQDNIANLVFASVAFGNVCNLKCRICSPDNSSLFATELINNSNVKDKKSHPVYQLMSAGNWIKDDNAKIWNSILDLKSNIVHFDLAGGEPMLSIRHFQILEQLVALNRAKDISIHYNTNGTVFPEKYISLLQQFKNVEIAISVDNIGKRFEYERPGVAWDIVDSNIKQFLALDCSVIKIALHLAVNIQNVYYLPEICNWIIAQKFDSFHFSTLYLPEYLNISHLTSSANRLVLEKLSTYHSIDPTVSMFISNIINILKSAKPYSSDDFCNYMKNLDSIRDESFSALYPEISRAMEY